MKKIALFLVSIIAVVIAVAPFYLVPEVSGYIQLNRFSCYEELKGFLETNSQSGSYYNEGLWAQTFGMTPRAMESGATDSLPDYSQTNIQVEGVDEADIIKTDGEYIYMVSQNSVIILKAYPPEEAEILSQISLNSTIRGIFINQDKLAIFNDAFDFYETYEKLAPYESPRTFIKVYDISDRTSPALKRDLPLDGYYLDSRMISDYVYVVVNEPAYLDENEVDLPNIYSGDETKKIEATEIYYSNQSDYFHTFTTIVAINVQNDAQEATYKTLLLGATRVLYVSFNNIYITLPGQTTANGLAMTAIHRIHVEDDEIEFEASGAVPGYLLNQFSMDEYRGYFRIATTVGHVTFWGQTTSRNNVYVLDMSLHIVGALEDLAPGERIYSARFMGDRCYLVTFKKVDPLFVIDLENPYAPWVLGELKVTGYSDYLHPYDENHIIGIGKETEAAEEGDFAWYQGVKISLFDVSDVSNPIEVDKYEIGDRGTDSPLLRDHKALLFDRSRNLLVLPVLVAEIDESRYPGEFPSNAYGDYVWQGAYIFDISLDGLVLKGRITHLQNDSELAKSDYYLFSPYYVKRSLYIDNVLYTFSDKKIKMNSLEDLAEINEIELP